MAVPNILHYLDFEESISQSQVTKPQTSYTIITVLFRDGRNALVLILFLLIVHKPLTSIVSSRDPKNSLLPD